MFCENLLCKYIQTLFTATNNKCKYSFYNKLSELYNVVFGQGEEISLQKITSIDVTTMDLNWRSNISTYVALVKSSNTRISWLFYRQTKNKPITKSSINRRKTNAVKTFKLIYSFNVSINSEKKMSIEPAKPCC